jgi:hypothetical protein
MTVSEKTLYLLADAIQGHLPNSDDHFSSSLFFSGSVLLGEGVPFGKGGSSLGPHGRRRLRKEKLRKGDYCRPGVSMRCQR